MGLFETPFNSMKSGRKTVEVRLNDKKRRKLNIGDKIEFVKIPSENDTLTVEVTGLRKFNTFKEMYEVIPPEKEKEWGTLAITIKLEEQ
jgi:ASC-1-like (ASCH) protein